MKSYRMILLWSTMYFLTLTNQINFISHCSGIHECGMYGHVHTPLPYPHSGVVPLRGVDVNDLSRRPTSKYNQPKMDQLKNKSQKSINWITLKVHWKFVLWGSPATWYLLYFDIYCYLESVVVKAGFILKVFDWPIAFHSFTITS